MCEWILHVPILEMRWIFPGWLRVLSGKLESHRGLSKSETDPPLKETAFCKKFMAKSTSRTLSGWTIDRRRVKGPQTHTPALHLQKFRANPCPTYFRLLLCFRALDVSTIMLCCHNIQSDVPTLQMLNTQGILNVLGTSFVLFVFTSDH